MAKNNKQLSKVYEERSENNPSLTLSQEKRLYQLYQEQNILDAEFFNKYKSCENVVVFGNPRCGKSTVIQSILGHELKSIPNPKGKGYFRIDLADPSPESKIKIFHNPQAEQQTLTSASTKDITIWECPALYKMVDIDGTDDKIKMEESPRVMQLLKTLDSVKFIFVTHYNRFNDCRGQGFSWTANVIASIFSNIDIIEKSILLVVTNAPKNIDKESIIWEINKCRVHEISENTRKMLEYFNAPSICIFYSPTQEGEVKGPTMEDIADLSFCNVTQVIQYPRLSSVNQELALARIQEYDARIQEKEAKRQLEQAEINIKNNAWFFIKVVDFLHEILSGMSILTKAGQYAGGMLMTFSSFIGINNLFKSYGSSNKKEEVVEEDELLKPMSPEKAKLAKCLVKMLNENNMLKQKLNECIEQYNNCHNEADKKTIVKQFSEWIISETNFQQELQTFETESHIGYEPAESYSSDDNSGSNSGNPPSGSSQSVVGAHPTNPLGSGGASSGGDGHESANNTISSATLPDNNHLAPAEGAGNPLDIQKGGEESNAEIISVIAPNAEHQEAATKFLEDLYDQLNFQ